MANALATLFSDIAAAIKAKNGEEGVKYKPIEFPAKILGIKADSEEKKLICRTGEFKITSGVKTIAHNLGVSPDIVVYFLSNIGSGTYISGSDGYITGEIAYSAELMEDGAQRIMYLCNGSTFGVHSGMFGTNEDEDKLGCVRDANPETFKVGQTGANRFCANATYRWAAIGGLKEHNEFYTVRFYDGESLLKTETVKYGTVLAPPEPEKKGYIFDGWEPALTEVKADANYSAKWVEEFVVVEEGSLSDTVTWQLSSTGTLIVSGSGAMPDYGYKGASPFYNRTDITSVVVRSGITAVGQYAFPDCEGIVSVTLPDTLTKINSYAFINCSALVDFAIPSQVTTIGSNIISYSQVTSLTIPASVTSIAAQAFSSCGQLTSVTFEVTGGWMKKKGSGTATSADVTVPTTNATHLTSTYVLYRYYRS